MQLSTHMQSWIQQGIMQRAGGIYLLYPSVAQAQNNVYFGIWKSIQGLAGQGIKICISGKITR